MNIKGTPKDLVGAIRNGQQAFHDGEFQLETDAIKTHVLDWLAQRFTAATMANKMHLELWESIIKKEEK